MKIKTLTLLIGFILMVSLQTNAQAPGWGWAKSAGGISNDQANAIVTDASNHVYVAGNFWSPEISFGSTQLINSGESDVFITKYNSDGSVMWATSAGGDNAEHPSAICTDPSGNIYAGGSFKSATLTFGSVTLTNSGGDDLFIVKYDSNGNVIWAITAISPDNDEVFSLDVDESGNLYATGMFSGTSISFGSVSLPGGGANDLFIASYDTSGNFLWAQSAGGSHNEAGQFVKNDGFGNVYTGGYFSSTTLTLGTFTVVNVNDDSYDWFLAKLDHDGTVLWLKSGGGEDLDFMVSADVDTAGNVVATGDFVSESLSFGSTTLTNSTSGVADVFVVKFTPDGDVVWAESIGGDDEEEVFDIALDQSGNMVVTGTFYGSYIMSGSSVVNNSNTGWGEIYIAEYDNNGDVMWVKSVAGDHDDYPYSIALDGSDNVYIGGSFYSSSISFGSTVLMNNTSSYMSGDIFIAKTSGLATSAEAIVTDGMPCSFYPNPFSTLATLTIPNWKGDMHQLQLKIYSVTGYEVKQYRFQTSSLTIQRGNLPEGMYWYRVFGNEEVVSEGKLIIE